MVYLAPRFPLCLQSSCYIQTVVTQTETRTVNTILFPPAGVPWISANVTACYWDHSLDQINFTITMTRSQNAPSMGALLLYYNPNGVTYGPGGSFNFGISLNMVAHASASKSGFDRSRACIVSEWTPVLIPVSP